MLFSGAGFNSGSHVAFIGCAPRSPLIWRDPQPFSVFHAVDILKNAGPGILLTECFSFWICLKDSDQHFQPEHVTEYFLALLHVSNMETQYPLHLIGDVDLDHLARCCPNSPLCIYWFSLYN